MKRVETINVNGIVFSIDDDAYGKLGSYLDALGKYFENEQGGREIIADIEARISELFAERDGGVNQVVTLADVAKVIETLGTPEDIAGADADEVHDNEKKPRPVQPKKPMRHLYRDPDHRYLGGVCAGLGAWLGINPIIIRLIFLFFVFFPFIRFIPFHATPVLIYFILWVIIPKAKTTTQKLEMRGEPVTISNIEKNIKESFSNPSLKQSFRNFLNEAGEFFNRVFGVVWRVVTILVGLFLCFAGICFGVAVIGVVLVQDLAFTHKVEWDFLSFTELFRHIISPASYTVLMICAVLIVALLVFALIFWGVKLIVGFKIKHKLLHVALSVVWIAAIVTSLIVCFSQARNFMWRNDQVVEARQVDTSDTLYLAMATSKLQISNNPMEVYFDKDNEYFYGKPNLHVQKSEDGQTKLRFKRESKGESKRAAYQYAESIMYNVEVRDSLLTFDPYFTVTPQNKWKFQDLDVVLYVPEGTVIVADNALCHDRVLGRWFPRSNNDCKWIMTKKDGLQRLDKKKR